MALLELTHLPDELSAELEKPMQDLSLKDVEKLHIKRVIEHTKDYDEAAKILGIDPATLWRKRKKYGL